MRSSTDTLLSWERGGEASEQATFFIYNDKGWQMYSSHLSVHNERRKTSDQALMAKREG